MRMSRLVSAPAAFLLLLLFVPLVLLASCLDAAAAAAAVGGKEALMSGSSVVSVVDFGADPTGQVDSTQAFADALEAVSQGGVAGGVVMVPNGQFLLGQPLKVPAACSVQGTYLSVPSHSGVRDAGQLLPDIGSVLLLTWGQGDADATAAISLAADATLKGVVLYHPNQLPEGTPTPFPWAVDIVGDNAAVMDVELLNSYQGIRSVGSARFNIARVQGQPILAGIYIDEMYDIGRVTDVHFNPWFSVQEDLMAFQLTHGVAFAFARADWVYVLNTFAFGYSIGYRFIETEAGPPNGNFAGIGMDCAANASVLVEASQPAGILITNGEFTAFVCDYLPEDFPTDQFDPTQIVVKSGVVRISNSAFWGPANQVARLEGGSTTFSTSTFVEWNADNPAIRVSGDETAVSVASSDFMQDSAQLDVEGSAKKLVFMGNTVKGELRVDTDDVTSAQVGLNAPDA